MAVINPDALLSLRPVPPLEIGSIPDTISDALCVCDALALLANASSVARAFPLMNPLVFPIISLFRSINKTVQLSTRIAALFYLLEYESNKMPICPR